MWSPDIARATGINLPVVPVKGQLMSLRGLQVLSGMTVIAEAGDLTDRGSRRRRERPAVEADAPHR